MYNITRTLHIKQLFKTFRFYSSKKYIKDVNLEKIRNLGILAHIDAGKTTTTERMLYYSGLIDQMGEVHHGNTVTDYMDQERERGITIKSAAVTFNWKKHQFNLIDTPGHIDFTMEVEQTLNVLDGAVIILDGCAGVEAQTLTVWRQAERFNIPKIVYVNKMDRPNANIHLCCESITKKLECPYLLLQAPVLEDGKFTGVIDLLSLEMLQYGVDEKKSVKQVQLTEKDNSKLWKEAKQGRLELIDKLTSYNDDLAEKVIASGSLDDIKSVDVIKALREVTLAQRAVPVLLGSSYKNIGVQSLMDAVVLYLPSPIERNQDYSIFEENFCGRAFKVLHDRQKGPLVFIRLYNGVLSKGQKMYSVQQETSEQSSRLFIAYADELKDVESVRDGSIAVVTGLKRTCLGDLLTVSQSAFQKAQRKYEKLSGSKDTNECEMKNIFKVGTKVAEPVFFCSIEPPSMSFQSALDQALNELQREDPSLQVSYNSDTGQTILGGMGELHLEIIRDRILREYKVDAELGPLQIAYRESPLNKITDQLIIETKIGNNKQSVMVKLSLLPVGAKQVDDVLRLDRSPEAASAISSIYPRHMVALRQGIEIGLGHGPKMSAPVCNVQVMLHLLQVGKGTSDTVVSATATQLVQKLINESGTEILEPVMDLEIILPDEYLSSVMADLTRRRSIVHDVSVRGNSKIVFAEAPLGEMMGYSTILRTLTSGMGTFTMEFSAYKGMSENEEENAIRKTRGF